jgi:hypothetical protein
MKVNFTVNAEGVVSLCRQGWLYEDREEWAKTTLAALAVGISYEDILSILQGTKTLKNTPDGVHCELVTESNEEWIAEIKEHGNFITNKYYLFADRKVDRSLVDIYANEIVGRIRASLRIPGISFSPTAINELYEVELRRQKIHHEIFKSAGFTEFEISKYRQGGGSEEIKKFAMELSAFVDVQAEERGVF